MADGGEDESSDAEDAEDAEDEQSPSDEEDANDGGETEDDGDGDGENGDASDGDGASEGDSADSGGGTEESIGSDQFDDVREVRETVESLAPEIIGRKLDAVIEVDGRDSGWQAVVEIVERPAVPDTQDILGRYQIDIVEGAVTGYRRIDRYRRGDTTSVETV